MEIVLTGGNSIRTGGNNVTGENHEVEKGGSSINSTNGGGRNLIGTGNNILDGELHRLRSGLNRIDDNGGKQQLL